MKLIKVRKNNSAITLIALVVTIIVLLILAGISISMLTGKNGILKRAADAKVKSIDAQKEEEENLQEMLNQINSIFPSTDGYVDNKKVNSPKLSRGMIPIKWDENQSAWVVCDVNDNWYNYDNTKQWANVMLSDGKYKSDTVKIGQVVSESELGSMYVWIPRYAYQIVGEKNIKVTFLKGNTNEGSDGKIYSTNESVDTSKESIVHPAFNIGGSPINGFWIAKFEASGTDKNGNAVGNGSLESSEQQFAPDEKTNVKSLPNKISWRYLSVGDCESWSMDIASKNKNIYGLSNASSHLTKNSEWGAVAYLCYSDYGNVPKNNGASHLINGYWCDIYTGQGPQSTESESWYVYDETGNHSYDKILGKLSSTTGNVTGVYDMAGGSWEMVAGYLDNGNSNLNNNGGKYFENGSLKSGYSSIWDAYETSDEEKKDEVEVNLKDGSTTIVRGLLNNSTETLTEPYQQARYKITKYTFDKMNKHKGIGINEISKIFSFFAPSSIDGNWNWFKDINGALNGSSEYISSWDNDYLFLGYMDRVFIHRGGDGGDGISAGIMALVTGWRRIN